MKFTSVVSYHTNVLTCGVARFNQELARRLNIPMVPYEDGRTWGAFPLLSLKFSEMSFRPMAGLNRRFGVLWHDEGYAPLTQVATFVMFGDPSLGSPAAWCPPVIPDLPKHVSSQMRIFTCGMAHKLDAAPYVRLRELLDATPHTAQLRLSVAVHEGTSLTDAELHFGALKTNMGRHVVAVLGCLTDEAMARELKKALAVTAFYPKGVRANNTTAHAAMSQGRALITNLDADSPKDFIHNDTCFDIHQMTAWPTLAEIDRVAKNGRELYESTYDWIHLVDRIGELCANSR